MTNKQRRDHKLGNQLRRLKLLSLYYKVKPSSKGWIANPGFIQRGKYTQEAIRLIKTAIPKGVMKSV